MKGCRDHQKTLWMDIFNELRPSERREWERHLDGCESCRAEKRRGLRMITMARRTRPRQSLSGAAVQRIARRSMARSGCQTGKARRPGFAPARFPLLPFRQWAAGAAALLLLAVLAWWNVGPDVAVRQAPVLSDKEVEVIEHLDLLREMDALQKLVKRVDREEAADGNPDDREDRRTRRDEEGRYV